MAVALDLAGAVRAEAGPSRHAGCLFLVGNL